MTFIDFDINMELAEIYNTQEFYSTKALDVFDAMSDLTTSTHHRKSRISCQRQGLPVPAGFGNGKH